MMITPVGVAYTFRMITDTTKGPFAPFWQLVRPRRLRLGGDRLGGADRGDDRRHLAVDPVHVHRAAGGARGQPREQIEAAMVDGADRWQIFRHITLPAILPVSVTLVLIRVIEAFKIVDLPNVLTNGGPGIATESLTLHAFMAWRTLDLGGSAAVAYMLLFLVTFFCRRPSST